MIKFVLDSASDYFSSGLAERNQKKYEDLNVQVVPLILSTQERTFIDDKKLDVSEMISIMENHKGRSYTACPSMDGWLSAYEGGDEIFVITITSGLSGTYNSAMVAREEYLAEHPEAKIEVFDSLSTGPEMYMIFEKLAEGVEKGLSFEENTKVVREMMPKMQTLFSLKSLHNLAENGRVNKLVASAVGALGLSIIGKASTEGTIEPIGKCRGEKKAVATICAQLEKDGYRGGRVRICHVENPGFGKMMADAILEKYPEADVLYYPARGLCSFYAERGGIILGCE